MKNLNINIFDMTSETKWTKLDGWTYVQRFPFFLMQA